eukprot:361689-Chlamydomonas_euryale.AAC.8
MSDSRGGVARASEPSSGVVHNTASPPSPTPVRQAYGSGRRSPGPPFESQRSSAVQQRMPWSTEQYASSVRPESGAGGGASERIVTFGDSMDVRTLDTQLQGMGRGAGGPSSPAELKKALVRK